ncbi:MAG: vWA domain-containing protein [Pseudomonadota bacterium]
MLEFAAPWWLLALPVPWLVWLSLARRRRGKQTGAPAALIHAQADILAELAAQPSSRSDPVPWLWILGCTLLLTALARPQWVDTTAGTYQGRDFLLAIDVSGSMRAQDFVVDGQIINRLDMLKRVVDRFLVGRRGDRIGLIVFGDDAYTLAPLTGDLDLVRTLLDEVRNGMAGEKTALGNAVALAVERLRDHEATTRTLVLLTDGSNTAGTITPEAATMMAKEESVRIYAVGIGSHRKVPFPRGANEAPAITEMPLDEDVLRRMAQQTGGRYYLAENTEEMRRIITDIELLEKVDIRDNADSRRSEWYWLPLAAGLVLLLVWHLRARREVLP